MNNPDLHPTQLGILNKLLFAPNLRYTDLKIEPDMENNTFQFHLDKVISLKLVEKTKDGYSLTTKGKKIANHIKVETNKLVNLRKISATLYCIRGKTDVEALIYTRLKHPFYGKQGFPAGKIEYGEEFVTAAKRELMEETGLTGEPVLFRIIHYLVKDEETEELLDDKLFFAFFVKDPEGDLVGNEEGEYEWVPAGDLENHITNPFDTIEVYQEALEMIKNFSGEVVFEEHDHYTADF